MNANLLLGTRLLGTEPASFALLSLALNRLEKQKKRFILIWECRATKDRCRTTNLIADRDEIRR